LCGSHASPSRSQITSTVMARMRPSGSASGRHRSDAIRGMGGAGGGGSPPLDQGIGRHPCLLRSCIQRKRSWRATRGDRQSVTVKQNTRAAKRRRPSRRSANGANTGRHPAFVFGFLRREDCRSSVQRIAPIIAPEAIVRRLSARQDRVSTRADR